MEKCYTMGKSNISPFLAAGTNVSVLASHDQWLNQSVTDNANVTFGSLRIHGDTVLEGSLSVLGTRTVSESSIVKYKTHILILNDGEYGEGVHLNIAGLEIDRGTSENYRFVYRESDKSFRIGKISATQAACTREDLPLDKGLMVWNASEKMIKSTKSIDLDVNFNQSVNIGETLKVSGDSYHHGKIRLVGNPSNVFPAPYISSTSDNLHIVSQQSVLISAGDVKLPEKTPFYFGSSLIYEENNEMFIATGTSGKVRFSNTLDALSRSNASVVFNGGVSLYKSMLFSGSSTDVRISATGSDILSIISSSTSTVLALKANPSAPNTQLQLLGPENSGMFSITYMGNDNFHLKNSKGNICLYTCENIQQVKLNIDGSTQFGGQVILNPSHTLSTHAVSKGYVDEFIHGLSWKQQVKVATVSPVNIVDIMNGYSVDGVILVNGDRILVKDSVDPIYNGIWVVGDDGVTNAIDLLPGVEIENSVVFVSDGIVNRTTGWVSVGKSRVGTDGIYFSKFTGLGQISLGRGLKKELPDRLFIDLDENSLEFDTNKVRISNAGLGVGLIGGSGAAISVSSQLRHVTEVGTLVGSSTWNGHTVDVTYGGTGQTFFHENGIVLSKNGILCNYTELIYDKDARKLSVDGATVISGDLEYRVLDVTTQISGIPLKNCRSVSIYSALLTRNGPYVYLDIKMELYVESHAQCQITIAMPFKDAIISNHLDVHGPSSGYCIAPEGLISLENVLSCGVLASKDAMVQFTSNHSTYVHKITATLKYRI